VLVLDHLSVVMWDGARDVVVKYDDELNKRGAKLVRYDNQRLNFLSDVLDGYHDQHSNYYGYEIRSEPTDMDGELIVAARGSGKRGFLYTRYEYWLGGFLAEIELSDGTIYYSLAEANLKSRPITVTFTMENSQQVRVGDHYPAPVVPPFAP